MVAWPNEATDPALVVETDRNRDLISANCFAQIGGVQLSRSNKHLARDELSLGYRSNCEFAVECNVKIARVLVTHRGRGIVRSAETEDL